MGSFWKRDGKVIVDGSKRPIFCDTCPCGVPPDCYANVIAALRERQRVLDYVDAISVWPEVPDPKKTLAQCIAEVNSIAVGFLSGTYSGGSAATPNVHSDTYANGASDYCELYDLVKALVTTCTTGSATSEEKSLGFGVDSGGEEPWYEALNAALADFKYVGGQTPHTTASYIKYRWGNTKWEAEYCSSAYRVGIVSQTTHYSHVIRIFVGHYGEYEFSDCGFNMPAENTYGLVDTIDAGFTNVSESNFIGNQYDPSSGGPASYGGKRYTWYARGYGVLYRAYVLIDWTFKDP